MNCYYMRVFNLDIVFKHNTLKIGMPKYYHSGFAIPIDIHIKYVPLF